MGEFNKDQGKEDQTGQQTDKPAFGQFDKEQGQQQDQVERARQGREELAGAEGKDGGQQQANQDRTGQQGDNQEMNRKGQGDDQNR